MAWFDGTKEWSIEQLETNFPKIILENLRTNADGTRVAIINTFEKGSKLYELADPHLENGVDADKIFYHIFMGDEAPIAQQFIDEFVAKGYGKNEADISLFRREDDELLMYSYGEIHTEQALTPEMLECCKEISIESSFVLPLTIFTFDCPACGARALQYRGMFEICKFCGWEDGWMEDLNGDYTPSEYRELYRDQLYKRYGKPFETLTKEEKIFPEWKWDKQKDDDAY